MPYAPFFCILSPRISYRTLFIHQLHFTFIVQSYLNAIYIIPNGEMGHSYEVSHDVSNTMISNYFLIKSNHILQNFLTSWDIHLNPGPRTKNTIIMYDKLIRKLKPLNDHLKYTHINAQNLGNKNNEYKQLVNDLGENNILGVSETWFDETNNDLNWVFDKTKFEIFRNDRNKSTSGKTKGGGVMLLVPKKTKTKVEK